MAMAILASKLPSHFRNEAPQRYAMFTMICAPRQVDHPEKIRSLAFGRLGGANRQVEEGGPAAALFFRPPECRRGVAGTGGTLHRAAEQKNWLRSASPQDAPAQSAVRLNLSPIRESVKGVR